jgi:hypothetical protein
MLKVTCTPPNLAAGTKGVKFTVVKATVDIKVAGTWTVPQNKSYGHPTLGPVTPGTPAGTTGFHKIVEIQATITPCVNPLPRCTFIWESEKLGYSGFISPDGKWKDTDPYAANGG